MKIEVGFLEEFNIEDYRASVQLGDRLLREVPIARNIAEQELVKGRRVAVYVQERPLEACIIAVWESAGGGTHDHRMVIHGNEWHVKSMGAMEDIDHLQDQIDAISVDWADILPKAIQGYSHDIEFSADGADKVQWTSGTIKFYDGTTQAINSGSETLPDDTPPPIMYVYFDLDDSDPDELKIIEADNYLAELTEHTSVLCVAQRAIDDDLARILPGWDKQPLITTDMIHMAGLKEWTDPDTGNDYAAVLATQISAGLIHLSSVTSFAAGYDPSTKRRVFTSTPTTPYDVGDLWAEGSTGNIYRCKTAKASGTYDAGHWELASKYTDDTAADAAQAAADAAQSDADAAQGTADTAASDATTALSGLSDIAADAKVTPVEKLRAQEKWGVIADEYAGIIAQATAFGVSSADYTTAYDALDTYLNTTLTLFADMAATTDIVRATWLSTWEDYYDERTDLLNDIAAKAKALADTAQQTANVKRRVFTAQPTTPYDVGDLWVDANNVKRCTTARQTGAYQAGDWTATTLDAIADGSTYQRVLATQINAGQIHLSSVTSYDTGYDPSTKEEGIHRGTSEPDDTSLLWFDTSEGLMKRYDNWEWRALEGEWYDKSGVCLDATKGINIYGTDMALTTRKTKDGDIQCKVDSDGHIAFGGGKCYLSNEGVHMDVDGDGGQYLTLGKKDHHHWIYKGAGDAGSLAIHARENRWVVLLTSGTGWTSAAAFRIAEGGKQLLAEKKTTGDPASPLTAQFHYNSADGELRLYNGSSWHTVPHVLSTTFDLDGDFDSDMEVTAVKIGSVVTLTANQALAHSSKSAPASTATALPAAYRPSAEMNNVYYALTYVARVHVGTGGQITLVYYDWAGTLVARTSSEPFTISYVIT